MYGILVVPEFVHQQDDLSGIFGKMELDLNLPIVKRSTFIGGSLYFHATETQSFKIANHLEYDNISTHGYVSKKSILWYPVPNLSSF